VLKCSVGDCGRQSWCSSEASALFELPPSRLLAGDRFAPNIVMENSD
jgi:hypothetical protein